MVLEKAELSKTIEEQSLEIKTLTELLKESQGKQSVLEETLRGREDISFKLKYKRLQESNDMYKEHIAKLRDQLNALTPKPS